MQNPHHNDASNWREQVDEFQERIVPVVHLIALAHDEVHNANYSLPDGRRDVTLEKGAAALNAAHDALQSLYADMFGCSAEDGREIVVEADDAA